MIGRRMLLATIAACFILIPQNVLAQGKVAVEVAHRGHDPVGSRLVYQVKEKIRRSGGLRLTNIKEPKLIVHILSIDPFDARPGSATAYSYIITVGGIKDGVEAYIGSSLGMCGTKMVDTIAEGLVAEIDKTADDMRRN